MPRRQVSGIGCSERDQAAGLFRSIKGLERGVAERLESRLIRCSLVWDARTRIEIFDNNWKTDVWLPLALLIISALLVKGRELSDLSILIVALPLGEG